MAKRAKRKSAATSREGGEVSVAFIGEILDRAIGELRGRQRDLPIAARKPRKAIEFAIKSVQLTAKTSRMFCRSWFMKFD